MTLLETIINRVQRIKKMKPPEKISKERINDLDNFSNEMKRYGLNKDLVADAYDLARSDNDMYYMMLSWYNSEDLSNDKHIIENIRQAVDAYNRLLDLV